MDRIILSLLLILACTTVSAREVRKHSAGGTCGSVTAPAADTKADQLPAASKPVASTPQASSTPAKPVSQRSSGDSIDESAHAPSWHSFLPGMFR